MSGPRIVDIEIHHDNPRYLVHGVYDVLWTDNLDEAMQFLRAAVEQVELLVK